MTIVQNSRTFPRGLGDSSCPLKCSPAFSEFLEFLSLRKKSLAGSKNKRDSHLVSGTLLGARGSEVSKPEKVPPLMELPI